MFSTACHASCVLRNERRRYPTTTSTIRSARATAKTGRQKPHTHLEEELFYGDKDHKHAHGHGDSKSAFGAVKRLRAMSTLTTSATQPPIPTSHAKTFQDTWQPPYLRSLSPHKRRTSHDVPSIKHRRFLIDVEKTKREILAQEDTDGDSQITVRDSGPKSFIVGTADSAGFHKFEIRGTYALSNLLQELALASEYGRKTIVLHEDRINENPVDRMSRLIKYHFWDALTRRIDADGLEKICADPKNRGQDQRSRIYVPFHDEVALKYYLEVSQERPHLNLHVVRLPEIILPEFVRSINISPGILSLALRQQVDTTSGQVVTRGAPFVVPGGRFNEMYGWDSYFEALGLIADDRVELARGMVENFHYEIEHYGKILNANRSYYLTRSQPPFLTDMIIRVHKKLAEKGMWKPNLLCIWVIRGIRAALKELLSPYADRRGLSLEKFSAMYNSSELLEPDLDQYFVHDRAVRESGHDTTYRFEKRCANLATVDLASLVYKYQQDLSMLIEMQAKGVITVRVRRGKNNINLDEFCVWRENVLNCGLENCIGNNGNWDSSWARGIIVMDEVADAFSPYEPDLSSAQPTNSDPDAIQIDYEVPEEAQSFFIVRLTATLFSRMAKHTRTRITQYLWSPSDKMFFDWDCALHERSVYETVTCLWTLWAGCATKEQADAMVPVALERFEVMGGLVSGTEESRGSIGVDRPNRQWDYPFGWAPHQIMAWVGLDQYGFTQHARRVCYRWLYVITKSFVDFNGVVPEKFDVVNMTHRVNVEYGNVGSDFQFVAREGFGWMNASYQLGLLYFSESMRRALGTLTPPDQLFRKLRI
ncbi:hypothetical protein BSLG_000460 [Batrachochytrium salamandrivorans]|nr:hypothetical protein BSLG_000460 [Batrachochytrium salamandrivorans]